jgi:nicotinate dehydrogenase subunit B
MNNMAHARIVRPPNDGSTLISVDATTIEKMPGVIRVVYENNDLGAIGDILSVNI